PAAPHSTPPRVRAPRWLRWLARKLLAWLIFVLLTLLALYATLNAMFGSNEHSGRPAAEDGGGTYHHTTILAKKPYEAVRTVYDAIAQDKQYEYACGRFYEATQQDFADNLGYSTCRRAVQHLQTEVTDVNSYAESIPSSPAEPIESDTVTIDSCDFAITGGPALGRFTVTEVDRGQWLITSHEKGPEQCPETSGKNTAPTR